MLQCQIAGPAPRSPHYNQRRWPSRDRVPSPHGGLQTALASPLRIGHNGKRGRSRDSERRGPTSPRVVGLGKRRRIERSSVSRRSTPTSRRGRSPAANRQFRPPVVLPEPQYELCKACSEICWDKIDDVLNQDLSFRSYKGRWVCDVGRRFRKLSPDNDCTLCHLLHAPWIEPFFNDMLWRDRKNLPDKGDSIHVFPNLQHTPHISNFPTGKKVLQANNADYHIAVVPTATPHWKDPFLGHLAKNGLVVVLDDRRPESKILRPQQVPPKFNPKHVRLKINTCHNGHNKRCNAKLPEPEVQGMRVIDCSSEHLEIVDHVHGKEYVALSYVWGTPNPSGNTTQTNTTNSVTPRPQHPPGKRILRLPRKVPRTIRDAIKVTTLLGYQYLWVDMYCIDQHNPEEQKAQFSRMGDLYGGSQLAIFALGDDSEAGLPGVGLAPRLPQRQCRIGPLRFVSTLTDPHQFIKYSKWATRGWTYQEGLFSTRRLFFTNQQVYYECNAMNTTESLKSDMDILHTLDRQRFRAYHRAGQFVCGNSSSYSHLPIGDSHRNHRKVDTLRRCQSQIAAYTRRELTKKEDVLHAQAAIARYYAKTPARIASLSGLAVPSPMAFRGIMGAAQNQEALDYLTYALAWTHEIDNFNGLRRFRRRYSEEDGKQLPWSPDLNPKPQRRLGFPSWSWSGWFGPVRNTVWLKHKQEWVELDHLPYCWTSLLSDVEIGLTDGRVINYHDVHQGMKYYQTFSIRNMSMAQTLTFNAYVLPPRQVVRRLITTRGSSNSLDLTADLQAHDPEETGSRNTCGDIEVRMSSGPSSMEEFREVMYASSCRQSPKAQVEEENRHQPYYQCIILGTHAAPREELIEAIKAGDPKYKNAKRQRIELFERVEPNRDDIVCLVVRTDPKTGYSYRRGLMTVRYYNKRGGLDALRFSGWSVGEMKRIVLK
ncbi:Heterokaryon incompatibility protein (HET) domain containing protein [Rhypophila decipiens]